MEATNGSLIGHSLSVSPSQSFSECRKHGNFVHCYTDKICNLCEAERKRQEEANKQIKKD